MDTIFVNSENSKTFEPHFLILELTDKLDLRIGEKSIALFNLSIYYTLKNTKSSYNNNKISNNNNNNNNNNNKILAPTWNDKLNYLMDFILYQIFKIILSIN